MVFQSSNLDKEIVSISLYKPRSLLFRYDIFPFITSYAILYLIYLFFDIDTNIKKIILIILPLLILTHLVLFLISQYSSSFKILLSCIEVSNIKQAKYVLVKSAKFIGKDTITLIKHRLNDLDNKSCIINNIDYVIHSNYFEFQKITYDYDSNTNTFNKQKYPIEGNINDFLDRVGYDDSSYELGLTMWGFNDLDIPLPDFFELYADHLTAPFFIFQVACLFLWSLDDYWYYSLFTLMMLMIFEGVLCNQRLNSVQMLRNMRPAAVPIFVYRNKTWLLEQSDRIVPGDIISLSRETFESNENSTIPCDALLLSGNCIVNEAMLTGESTPQVKESLIKEDAYINLLSQTAIEGSWKKNLVFSGTELIHNHSESESYNNIPESPDNGAIGFVIHTAFRTSQGDLMRSILYAQEGVSASTIETFYLIGILVFFAIIASSLVLYYGLQDKNRNKFKLVLHCIMIITSVVPPELPMELSLAITNSLAALAKDLIHCTEPHRIPYGGRINVTCFDKTGTLTRDILQLRGVESPQDFKDFTNDYTNIVNDKKSDVSNVNDAIYSGKKGIILPEDCSSIALCAMGSCHSVFVSRDKLSGDNMEIITLEESGFTIESSNANKNNNNIYPTLFNKKLNIIITIIKRFPFNSTLKRMSVIVKLFHVATNKVEYIMFIKGAPEVLQDKYIYIPSYYTSSYKSHMSHGKRVLSIGYKNIPLQDIKNIQQLNRFTIENQFLFLGLLIYNSELKADSYYVIKELKESNHQIMIITGDGILTAIDVGRKLNILKFNKRSDISKSLLILSLTNETNELIWYNDNNSISIDFNVNNIQELSYKYDLCIIGVSLDILIKQNLLKYIIKYVIIYARVTPKQKTEIILKLNESGLYTVMCGDGTNDVGALKAASVGVSIINNIELEKKVDEKVDSLTKNKKSNDRTLRALIEFQEQEKDPTIVKLGDASIASSFTSRRTSIDCVLTIIRQGRTTLITTIEIYKILSLNCLITAYSMSILYLNGLRQGDIQMTAIGLLSTVLFYLLSQTKPLQILSSKNPPSSIFNKAIIFSIVGQFIVNLSTVIISLQLCYSYNNSNTIYIVPDGNFSPNIINSTIFIISALIQINNFSINYYGEPFTQSLINNVNLFRCLGLFYFLLVIVVIGQIDILNDLLQLIVFPTTEYKLYVLAIMFGNCLSNFIIEKISRIIE